MNAEVSINGNLAALQPYGYSSFLVDLKPYLKVGEENLVSVTVNNSAQPNSRWYSGTGIYRHVWLRTGEAVHIQPWGIFVTTPEVNADSAQVAVAAELTNDGAATSSVFVRSSVRDPNGMTVAQVETQVDITPGSTLTVKQKLNVPQPKLWSVDEPALYTLDSEAVIDGLTVDTAHTVFGIRTIEVDAENGFRLNGVPMKLKGGCVHHDNGLLGSASYDRAEERKIELMKAAGYNAIRCAHNPPAPAMLDACDRLGMLVINETFDCWRTGKNTNDYHLYFEDWWQRDTEAMLKHDRNHPSIIMWSIGNEVAERTGVSNGYAWAKKQADFVRSLDDTRWVTSAVPFLFEEMMANPEAITGLNDFFELSNGIPTDPEKDRWGNLTQPFCDSLDVVGYNYLYNRYENDRGRFPQRVICGTETFPHHAYATWDSTRRLSNVIGDFVWTSIDYLGESGIGKIAVDAPQEGFMMHDPWPFHLANCGDIDICGFKRPQSYYRDILWGVRNAPYIGVLDPQVYGKKITFSPWGWEPVLESWTFPGSEGKLTQVDVYSDSDEVELIVNGSSAGRKPTGAANKNKTSFEVPYLPGVVEAVAYTKGVETGRFSLKSASSPASLRLTTDRQSLNAEYGDLAYVTVEIVDETGEVVKPAEHVVTFEVSGAGDLLAVGTANPTSEELYVGSQRKAFQGRLMAVVRTTGAAGDIILKASADGLKGAELRLTAGY
jgi:beta-galactosidase